MTPEEAAANLLQDVWRGEPPLDIVEVAEEHEGLDVQRHADLRVAAGMDLEKVSSVLSGLLIPRDRRIWINAEEAARSEGRMRFTVAHELGHWRMHRSGKGRAQARFCRRVDVGATGPELKSTRRLEAEANRFAAELLMPSDEIARIAPEIRFSVPRLALLFGVSAAAMQVRLEVLKMLPDYMRNQ